MEEIWRDISGYEGLYQISSNGNVKSLKRKVNSPIRNNSTITRKERILRYKIRLDVYPGVTLYFDNKRKFVTIHRLVAIAFIPNDENKPFVNHINGMKHDNRIENLEWVTCQENTIHAFKTKLRQLPAQFDPKLRSPFSYKNSDLEIDDVNYIRSNRGIVSAKKLSGKFQISETAIRNIWNRVTYKNV